MMRRLVGVLTISAKWLWNHYVPYGSNDVALDTDLFQNIREQDTKDLCLQRRNAVVLVRKTTLPDSLCMYNVYHWSSAFIRYACDSARTSP